MNNEVKELIDKVYDEGVRGASQPREVIIRLLELDPSSEEVAYLKERAAELAHIVTGNSASISGAIGVDLCSCDMNCKFCAFGTEWGLVEEDVIYSKEEIIELVRAYVEAGVTTITLRSTEFYDMNVLSEWLADIREAVPGSYLINLNVGEMSPAMAEAAYQAGATSAYHVIRMREGIDTPFDVDLRWKTVDAIGNSPLRWLTCVEPLGVEHTNEEIADRILENLAHRPHAMSVMARVNVPGTPFEGMDEISEERMLHLLATLRLVVGTKVRSCGMHPAVPAALYAGGSNFTVERGANPRDTTFNEDVWRGFTVEEAKALIEEAGFVCRPENPDPRFPVDGKQWWKVGDPADYIMPDPVENAGAGCCCGPRKKK